MVRNAISLFISMALLWAQSSRPSLHGRVLDSTRAPIDGAQVTVIPEDGMALPSVVSDQNGEFSLSLGPGRYTIQVTKKGFVETSLSEKIVNRRGRL